MAITLAQIKTQIQEIIDDPNADLVADSDLTDLINASGRRWHAMVVQLNPELFETVETVTPTGVSNYALDATHYKTLGVRYVDSGGESTPLRRIQYRERHRYDESGTVTQATAYYLSGENLNLVPAPNTGGNTYKHDYLRGWTALSSAGDNVGGFATNTMLDHYVDWIVYDVAIKARIKEEAELSALVNERNKLERDMQIAVSDREVASPQRVLDVRRRDDYLRRRNYQNDFWSNR